MLDALKNFFKSKNVEKQIQTPVLIHNVSNLLLKIEDEIRSSQKIKLTDIIEDVFKKQDILKFNTTKKTGEPRTDTFNVILDWIQNSISEKASTHDKATIYDKATISETVSYFKEEINHGLWDAWVKGFNETKAKTLIYVGEIDVKDIPKGAVVHDRIDEYLLEKEYFSEEKPEYSNTTVIVYETGGLVDKKDKPKDEKKPQTKPTPKHNAPKR